MKPLFTDFFDLTIDFGFGCKPYSTRICLGAFSYLNGESLAVVAYEDSGDEFDTITVNLPYSEMDEGEAYLDTNNCPWAVDFIKENGLAEPTGAVGSSGFCSYPIYKFDMSKFKNNKLSWYE